MINEFIEPLNITAICTATICGFVIGLERQLFGKPAGIRTSILICVGAYCFVALSSSLIGDSTDSSRVVGQIVTGIGFLGAGIMFNNGEVVQGITSASVVWIIAAVGCLTGFGHFGAAIGVTVLTVLVLFGVSFFEYHIKKFRKKRFKEE
ncbi:MAG: putative Mg2+ transporter-C (MgtC) family protein [Saprospiraceae bacterium]|jgi:putative Mg2+ transporter-C (MgtC) family protein